MQMLKQLLKGWRTLSVAIANLMLAIVLSIDPTLIRGLVSDQDEVRRLAILMMAYSAVLAGLRYITETPVGTKPDTAPKE